MIFVSAIYSLLMKRTHDIFSVYFITLRNIAEAKKNGNKKLLAAVFASDVG